MYFFFGYFFNDTENTIIINTFSGNNQQDNFFRLQFFEIKNNQWEKKNEYDRLQILWPILTRFTNYNQDAIPDFLIKAGYIGTGGNDIEYLFLFEPKTIHFI